MKYICERCGAEFEEWRKDELSRKQAPRFCSRACSNARKHTEESKAKISLKLRKEHKTVPCKVCGKALSGAQKHGLCVVCYNKDRPAEVRKLQSERMSERLRDPEKRKNYGRGKKSHMELYFENWLYRNKIEGWESEKHFWNDELRKNYFADFCFEALKLIIELDGTQHRNTIEADSVRDEWLSRQGYRVIRLSYEEYREGKWEISLLSLVSC